MSYSTVKDIIRYSQQLHRHASNLFEQLRDQTQRERVEAGLRSQGRWWAEHFSREHDWNEIPGEDNHFRYRPLRRLLLRLGEGCRPDDLALVLAGAATVGTPVEISVADELASQEGWGSLLDAIHGVHEGAEGCAQRVGGHLDRVRVLGRVEAPVQEACRQHGVDLLSMAALAHGRFELLRVVREQSISHAYHRYGNLGERES